MTGQAQVTELVERMGQDIEFASALEVDSLTALRSAGLDDLGEAAAKERDRVADLVDRIYRDDEFRQSVEQDPRRVLDDWGIPEPAIESVLIVAGAPEEVLERASADVEAHLSRRTPATIAAAAAVLGTLAFAQQASAGSRPATSAEVTSAAVAAEITSPAFAPEVTGAEISVAVAPEVSRATAKAQVSRATWRWQGVSMQRLMSQHTLASVLRIQ